VKMRSDIAVFLATYPTLLPTLSLHGGVHPPGPAVYYRAIILTLERHPDVARRIVDACARVGVEPGRLAEPGNPSAIPIIAAELVGGFSVILFGALTAWPIAAMVELAGGDAAMAAAAALLWAFCPAMAFFASEFNQVVTFFVAASGGFALVALRSLSGPAAAYALASGIAAGVALFCSFGAVPMLGTVALVAVAVAAGLRPRVRRLGLVTVFALLGIVAVFAIPMTAGYQPIVVARRVLAYHLGVFNQSRSRGLWLRFNLLDFANFAGWPLLAWGVVGLVRRRGRSPVLWAVIAAVAALDLADVTRGEVGRLWMPLTAPLYVAATISALTPADRKHESVLVAVLLASAALALEICWWG
jgi:hypothetical protein